MPSARLIRSVLPAVCAAFLLLAAVALTHADDGPADRNGAGSDIRRSDAGAPISGTGGAGRTVRPASAARRSHAQATPEELAELEAAMDDVQAVSRAFKLVAKIARPGVVHIRVSGGERETSRNGEGEERLRERLKDLMPEDEIERWLKRVPAGSGSGFVFDKDGYILTNNHVVSGRHEIVAVLYDNREAKATLVGTDPKTDLAVIKIDASDLHPLKFGDSDALEVGDWVIAVGSPFGLAETVTHGIVSAKGRSRVAGLDVAYQDFIQTDAAINPGNSGGPLLNLRGEVVGVNTAIATQGEAVNAGIAFTIPSNMAAKIARQLKATGTVERGWMGVSYSPITKEDVELFGLKEPKGVLVESVFRDSPAETAGLEVEDVIVGVDGKDLEGREQLRMHVADLHPGDVTKLRVIRNGKPQRVEIKLGLQPENLLVADAGPATKARAVKRLGLRVLTLRPGKLLTYDLSVRGVIVMGLDSDAWKDPPKISLAEVIVACDDKPVKTAQELIDVASALPADQTVKVEILEPNGDRRIVSVRPPVKE